MRWNIRRKMLAAFGSIVLIILFMTGVNWEMMTRSIRNVEQARDTGYAGALLATSIRYNAIQVWQWLTDISATRGAKGYDDGFEKAEYYAQQFRKDVEALKKVQPEDEQQLDELLATFEAFYEKGKWMANQYIQGGPELGNLAMSEFDAYGEAISSQMDDLVAQWSQDGNGLIEMAIDQNALSRTLGLVFSLAALVIAMSIAVVFSSTMSHSIHEIVQAAKRITQHEFQDFVQAARAVSGGDLTVKVMLQPQLLPHLSRDEIGILGQAFNQMLEQLKEIGLTFDEMIVNMSDLIGLAVQDADEMNATSNQLACSAKEVDLATHQISDAIRKIGSSSSMQSEMTKKSIQVVEKTRKCADRLAAGAREQEDVVNKTTAMTAQMVQAIQQVTANAQEGARESVEAAQAASAGSQTVQDTLRGMETIKARVDLSAMKIKEMGQRSDQIGAIVATIEEIAGQTNLLAINAAIEAAQAGEHGKGFAVVAGEVRRLAEHSSTAAREISNLIEGIQVTVAEAVKAMDEGAREMDTGMLHAGKAGQALTNILQSIERVNSQVKEISHSAQSMSASSSELSSAMQAVRDVAETNKKATVELSENAAEMTRAITNIQTACQENEYAVNVMEAAGDQLSTQVGQVTGSMQALNHIAGSLYRSVSRFKLLRA